MLWLCVDVLHPVGAILYKVEKELIMLGRNAQQNKQIRLFPKWAHNKDKMSTHEVEVNFSCHKPIVCFHCIEVENPSSMVISNLHETTFGQN